MRHLPSFPTDRHTGHPGPDPPPRALEVPNEEMAVTPSADLDDCLTYRPAANRNQHEYGRDRITSPQTLTCWPAAASFHRPLSGASAGARLKVASAAGVPGRWSYILPLFYLTGTSVSNVSISRVWRLCVVGDVDTVGAESRSGAGVLAAVQHAASAAGLVFGVLVGRKPRPSVAWPRTAVAHGPVSSMGGRLSAGRRAPDGTVLRRQVRRPPATTCLRFVRPEAPTGVLTALDLRLHHRIGPTAVCRFAELATGRAGETTWGCGDLGDGRAPRQNIFVR